MGGLEGEWPKNVRKQKPEPMRKIIILGLIMLSACQPKNADFYYFSKNVEINNNVIEMFLSLCNDEFGKIKQKGFSFYEGYKLTKTGSMGIIYELTNSSFDTIWKFVSDKSIYSDTSVKLIMK